MIRTVFFVLLLTLVGCGTTSMKGEADTPDMQPLSPARDVEVDQQGDLICVVENGDPLTRRCVPRVHEEEQ